MTNNYRDTLNLPETELSMKAGLPRKEPEIIEFWNDIDIYKKLRELHENDETFICMMDPHMLMVRFILDIQLIRYLKILLLNQKHFLEKMLHMFLGGTVMDCQLS
jgi:isoleucyl-tRNA synthetase